MIQCISRGGLTSVIASPSPDLAPDSASLGTLPVASIELGRKQTKALPGALGPSQRPSWPPEWAVEVQRGCFFRCSEHPIIDFLTDFSSRSLRAERIQSGRRPTATHSLGLARPVNRNGVVVEPQPDLDFQVSRLPSAPRRCQRCLSPPLMLDCL